MKLLHINSYYVGTDLYKNLYDIQEKNGIDLTVYVPYAKGRIPAVSDMGQYSMKAEVFSNFDRLFFHKKHLQILTDIQNKIDVSFYDIIHAHSLFSNGYIAYKLNQKYDVPYIVAVRNTDVNVFFKRMVHLRNMGIDILKNASKIIFLSDSYMNHVLKKYIPSQYRDEFEKKSCVIPNGINKFWLENKYHFPRYVGSPVKILSVGELSKNKNQILSLRACDILREKGFDIRFSAVGKIIDAKIIDAINSRDYANYLGVQQKEKLIDIYREHDIFLMPSHTETFGLVYAEALSQGMPVIYTKGQGFDGQFDEGKVGYHVEASNPMNIATVIEQIISEYDEISARCSSASLKFDWSNIAKEYNNLYYDCLK